MKPERIVAFVPMRHHSVRVPGKNYRLLAGKPLFHHILITLQQVPEISQVVVDTDSPEITAGIREHFSQVRVLERPEHLRADTVPMNEILMYDVSQGGRPYLQTHSTNPLLRPETVSAGICALVEQYPIYDCSSASPARRCACGITGPADQPQPGHPVAYPDLPPVYARTPACTCSPARRSSSAVPESASGR